MKTRHWLLGVVALCPFVTSVASAQNGVAQEVLPKPEPAFSDAKIGKPTKIQSPGR